MAAYSSTSALNVDFQVIQNFLILGRLVQYIPSIPHLVLAYINKLSKHLYKLL